ncbi:hypothetical protein FRC01_000260 [Tulasnella sp. 417]|nr:hypothetical protein FRC01_000260 [Tulasnella sp. 417]
MKIHYSITDDDKLEVTDSKSSAATYTLKQNAATIVQVVNTLNSLSDRRAKEALDPYDDALYRYLVAMMRRVASFYKNGSWTLVQRTLSDFESREAAGFQHDPQGRMEWDAWKKRDDTPEQETSGPPAMSPNAMQDGGSDPITSSPAQSTSRWEDFGPFPTPGEEQNLPGTSPSKLATMQGSRKDSIPSSPLGISPAWEENFDDEDKEPEDASPPTPAKGDDPSPRKALTDSLGQLQLAPKATPAKSNVHSRRPPWAKALSAAPDDHLDGVTPEQQTQVLEQTLPGLDLDRLEPNVAASNLTTKQTPIEKSRNSGENATVAAKHKHKHKVPKPSHTKVAGAKRVALISVDEDGLAQEDGPATKRLRTKKPQEQSTPGLTHLLWDVLHEVKNRTCGKPTQDQETFLSLTREVLKRAQAKSTSSLRRTMLGLGSGGNHYFQPIEGLTGTEQTVWENLKAAHLEAHGISEH